MIVGTVMASFHRSWGKVYARLEGTGFCVTRRWVALSARQAKPSAVIISLGRGPVIDEGAMTAMLQDGRLRWECVNCNCYCCWYCFCYYYCCYYCCYCYYYHHHHCYYYYYTTIVLLHYSVQLRLVLPPLLSVLSTATLLFTIAICTTTNTYPLLLLMLLLLLLLRKRPIQRFTERGGGKTRAI